jgi:hypothetical protein
MTGRKEEEGSEEDGAEGWRLFGVEREPRMEDSMHSLTWLSLRVSSWV